MVDIFAAQFNHRLLIYVSLVQDPSAWAIYTTSWSGCLAYDCLPSSSYHPEVSRPEARADQVQINLITPPPVSSQPWFTGLFKLSHIPPLQLPLTGRT